MTLLINRTDLRELLDLDRCLTALRTGFLAPASPMTPLRTRTDLPGPGTATALLPGLIDGVPAYTVKVNAKFPGANPALREVVCLHDLALAEEMGALGNAGLTREHAAGTIGEVLRGSAGRSAASEVTVYAPVGLPWQDLALSWVAYQEARGGVRFDFLG